MKKTWLITGGAGFIGSHFVRQALHKTDAKLIVIDALTYAGDIHRIEDLTTDSRVKFIHEDICNKTALAEIFRKYFITDVIHFAAESHVDNSITDATSFLQTNILGTFSLLEAARTSWKNKGSHRFLHISTDEVFGEVPATHISQEQEAYNPRNPYAATKASADHLVMAWYHTYKLPTIITRSANNYGTWQFPEKLIPLMIKRALNRELLPIYGDGLQMRDWLYVEDHCTALLEILEKGKPGESYNISMQARFTNLDVVRHICDTIDNYLGNRLGNSARLITHVKDRRGHDRNYSLSNHKLKATLNWQPKTDFFQTLEKVVEWYIEHQDWLSEASTRLKYVQNWRTAYNPSSHGSMPS